MADNSSVPIPRPIASALAAIVVCILGLGLWTKIGQSRQSAKLAQLAHSQQEINSQVEKQVIILSRVVEAVTPAKPTQDWEANLASLESQVSDIARWPGNQIEASNFLNEAGKLVAGHNSRIEDGHLQRLNNVRWAAMAFDALYPPDDIKEEIDGVVERIEELTAAMPDGGCVELANRLQKEAGARSEKIHQRQLAEAKRLVQEFLASTQDANWETVLDSEALLAACEFLAEFKDADGHTVAEYQTICKECQERLLASHIGQQTAALEKRRDALNALEASQPALFESALNSLLGEVTTLRVALALEGHNRPELDTLEAGVRKKLTSIAAESARHEEDRQAKAVRDYQRWALQQIKEVERRNYATILAEVEEKLKTFKDPQTPVTWPLLEEWPSLRQKLERVATKPIKEAALSPEIQKAIYSACAKTVGWQYTDELAYLCVRDAMVKFLLPINPGQLEMPIQERYQRAFQQGWKSLDGREDQTHVAEKTVTVIKNPRATFWSLSNEDTAACVGLDFRVARPYHNSRRRIPGSPR
ncbi:MAG: hypothetical protein AB7O62_05640 [Pirellulales bacterium]